MINMYYLNYFFIFSFLGNVIERFFYKDGNSGILYGYWTPLYGIGVILIIFIYKFINNKIKKKIPLNIVLFISCFIILCLIELLAGYLIELIFKVNFWNYSNHTFNITKYTSLEMGFVWGIGSIILINIIKPLFDKIVNKIPKWIPIFLLLLFISDIIMTIIIKTK